MFMCTRICLKISQAPVLLLFTYGNEKAHPLRVLRQRQNAHNILRQNKTNV
jgi:hypothetical protein